jgi:pimeloyl-ACP methyl ester carboxylesterase
VSTVTEPHDNPAPEVDGVILVHGGTCAADIWDEVLPLLPFPAVAVDLPGRGSNPADLATVTIDDCVAAVIATADIVGYERVALIGHSLGGITITETAMRHPDRIHAVVYLAALVPPVGSNAATLMVGGDMPDPVMTKMPEEVSRPMFGNDLDDEGWASVAARLVDDANGIMNARITGHPLHVHRTYIDCTDDVPVPPALVQAMIPALGPDLVRRTIEAGHMVMNSRPDALAAVLAEVVRTA